MRAIQVIVRVNVPDEWRAEDPWWPEGGILPTNGDMLAHEWDKQLGRSGFEIVDITVDGNHIER